MCQQCEKQIMWNVNRLYNTYNLVSELLPNTNNNIEQESQVILNNNNNNNKNENSKNQE